MRHGGKSTVSIKNRFEGWRESARAYNEVLGSGGHLFVLRKGVDQNYFKYQIKIF